LRQRSEKLAVDLAEWLDQNPAFQTHSKGEIGWMASSPLFEDVISNTKNVTDEFVLKFWNEKISMQDLVPSGTEDFSILLVPGLFTQWYPGYMVHNVKALAALGLHVEVASLNTGVGVIRNAESLKDTVESMFIKTNKKVALFCHSKGALDAAAMLSLFPKTVPMVAALVAAQGTVQTLPM
jgi:hypothetical protein